ncbi:MAG: hypothetical protein SGI74_09610 [Oligoflexia bacterium]|nr:hypothetical protein [Oligoflexia bacterium]
MNRNILVSILISKLVLISGFASAMTDVRQVKPSCVDKMGGLEDVIPAPENHEKLDPGSTLQVDSRAMRSIKNNRIYQGIFVTEDDATITLRDTIRIAIDPATGKTTMSELGNIILSKADFLQPGMSVQLNSKNNSYTGVYRGETTMGDTTILEIDGNVQHMKRYNIISFSILQRTSETHRIFSKQDLPSRDPNQKQK